MTVIHYEVHIPHMFSEDHFVCRSLPSGRLIREGKPGTPWLWSCTLEELHEWLSDARHFSDCASEGWDFANQLGMQSSARATVKRVQRLLDTIPHQG